MYLAARRRSFHGFFCFIPAEQGLTRSDQSAGRSVIIMNRKTHEVDACGGVSSARFSRLLRTVRRACTTTDVECHQN